MKTQKEATYLLANALSGGSISDDSPIPKRRLLAELKIVLTQLKHRNLAKGIDFTNDDIYTLDCIDLEEVDRVSCPSIPPSGLKWMKSINPIPSFIKLIDVTDILGNISIPVVMWNKLSSHSKSRIKAVANSPAATFRNTDNGVYLYVLTTNKVVSATIVPNDYIDAVLFPRCGELSRLRCDYWEIPIGSSDNLLSEAIQFLKAEEIKVGASVKPDITNNDNQS